MTFDPRSDEDVSEHVRLIVAGMTAWHNGDKEIVARIIDELSKTPAAVLSLLEMCYVCNTKLSKVYGREVPEHLQKLGLATYVVQEMVENDE